jgi:mRNA-degrading endonuclease RelE of RelBE toxin-antitoxin system
LDEDVDEVGDAALAEARKAIDKKLKIDPEGYGETLGPPLLGLYKLKSSKVRAVYQIEMESREVWVLMIGPRKTIWKRAQGTILTRLAAARKLWSTTGIDPLG